MSRRTFPLVFALALALAPLGTALAKGRGPAAGRAPESRAVRSVEIAASRVTLGALLPGLGEAGDVDLGPTPAPGASRIVTREQITEALKQHRVRGVRAIPHAVRVSRQMEQLAAERLRVLAAAAIAGAGLRRGVSLKSLQPPASAKVASGWQSCTAQIAKSPRRAGEWSSTAMLSFEGEGQRLGRIAVGAVFDISAEGAAPDVSKGATVTLVVKSGLVEISTKGVANDNADVGDILPVMLRPSGKVVRARLVAKDRAVVEGAT